MSKKIHVERALKMPPHLRRGDEAPPPPPVYRVRRCRPESPAPQTNWAGASEHWAASLAQAQRTTELVHAKCLAELAGTAAAAPSSPPTQSPAAHLAARNGMSSSPPPAAAEALLDVPDTLALRRAIDSSLATQLELFNACSQAWAQAGAPRYA